MKKKLLSTVLCLAMMFVVFLLLPTQASAETPADAFICWDMGYDEWGMPQTWIAGIDSSVTGDIVIPYYINGCTVTGINDYAFEGNTGITSVSIPETVTHIGEYVFADCTNLKSVTIPEGVTHIGSKVFSRCTSLESIVLPDSVEYVGYGAFMDCTNLISADLGGAYEIGINVFYRCTNLKEVSLPGGLDVLAYGTFGYCSSLEEITLPNGLSCIDVRAFEYCTSLTTVKMPYDSLESIGDMAFRNCSSLKTITIPYGTKTIGNKVFFQCPNLEDIDVIYENGNFKSDSAGVLYNGTKTELIAAPGAISGTYTVLSTVTSIRSDAFYGCEKLTGVNLPAGLTTMGNEAFQYCTGLTEITIPESLTKIPSYTFQYCTGLTKVTIPQSLTTVSTAAFEGCSSLQEVYYDGTQEQWDAIQIQTFNEPLLNAKLILKGAHICTENGEWIVSAEPTFTAAGERTLVCSVCGETVTETLPMLTGEVAQWNIALKDDFEVKFHLQISQSIENTAQVKLTIGGQVYTKNVSELEKTEEGYYLLRAEVTATQMNDTITVQVLNGEHSAEEFSCSVREYCDTILADESQSQYHALITEMLNYGAMAQLYFDYNAEDVEPIPGAAATEIPEETEEMAISGALSTLEYYGASLVYRDRIAVRFYFTGDVTGCTFTAGGESYTPVAKNEMYYVEIADILPQNLDQQITLTVTDADGNTLTVVYGPMNYIVRMSQKGDEKTKNLLKALYNYHLAAKVLEI